LITRERDIESPRKGWHRLSIFFVVLGPALGRPGAIAEVAGLAGEALSSKFLPPLVPLRICRGIGAPNSGRNGARTSREELAIPDFAGAQSGLQSAVADVIDTPLRRTVATATL
jgi:hypothetical protein